MTQEESYKEQQPDGTIIEIGPPDAFYSYCNGCKERSVLCLECIDGNMNTERRMDND